jgi:hypothetical protein
MTITKRLTTAIVLCLVASLGGALGVLAYEQGDVVKEKQRPVTDRLTVAEFDRLHKKLTKMSTEKVWSIPWQLSVREARELAAKENKPVFLWISSNGGTHPLGPC